MTPKNEEIRKEIDQLRDRNKTMWHELKDMPDVRFVVNPEKRKHQLDLNANFRKNEARLERLHKKLDLDWTPTTELRDHRFSRPVVLVSIASCMAVVFTVVQLVN